jgi:hypothetical protein
MGNSNTIDSKDKINKSFTLCPLIKERILIKEKRTVSNTISCLGVIKYNNEDFILIGFDYGKIEIFDSQNLESVAEDHNEIEINEYLRYVAQLLNEEIIIVSQEYVRIYAFYLDEICSYTEEVKYCYNIKLLQKIDDPFRESYNLGKVQFSKAFYFDRSLYREYDIYQMEKEKNIRKKNPNYKKIYPNNEELIIGSHLGIFIYKRDNSEEINENGDTEQCSINEKNENNGNNKKKFDICSCLEKWESNPFKYQKKLSKYDTFDMIQVNFKYIAGTIEKYLCLYSMETYELVTKFSIKISDNCDSVIFMIKEDILCVGGDDTISLISIKKFEVILECLIKNNYRITEICILPDLNILIGMQKKFNGGFEHQEYFYQYKCFHKVNKVTKEMEYNLIKISSKLLTKRESNITMRCLSNNRLVTIVDLELIQVWK